MRDGHVARTAAFLCLSVGHMPLPPQFLGLPQSTTAMGGGLRM